MAQVSCGVVLRRERLPGAWLALSVGFTVQRGHFWAVGVGACQGLVGCFLQGIWQERKDIRFL